MLAAGQALWRIIGEKIQIKFGVWIFDLVYLFHTEELIILDYRIIRNLQEEVQGWAWLLDRCGSLTRSIVSARCLSLHISVQSEGLTIQDVSAGICGHDCVETYALLYQLK